MEAPISGQMGRLQDRGICLEILGEPQPCPRKVMEFHTKNLGVPCRICALTFSSIPFCPISLSSASSQCSSRGGVIIRETPPASSSTSLPPPAHLPLPLPTRPLMLHLSPPTRHHFRPASRLCHTGMPRNSVPYMYLLISVLFIISMTLYISPYPQVDPYPFLFGSLARYVHV